MDVEKYIELTGKIIPESQRTYFQAQINKAIIKLEALLGYTLTPTDIYKEIGQTQIECGCPYIPQSNEELLPPDELEGIWKVFPYNSKDKMLRTDPFVDAYGVKLVQVKGIDGEKHGFVSFKTFEQFNEYFVQNGIGTHIEKCQSCYCDCDCEDCVQLAVNARWVDFLAEDAPKDLLYLICDMVDFYSDDSRDIKSESVDGHSWSKGDIIAPETTEDATLLLTKLAGPFGSIVRMPVI